MARKTKERFMKETEEIFSFDAAIITVYEEVLNGKRKQFPKYTWELPNSLHYAKVLGRYIFEEKLKWSINDIKEYFTGEIFKKYRLAGMRNVLFPIGYDFINNTYPDTIKPWELRYVTRNFWDSDENKREALLWLFEEKLQWDIEKIKEDLTIQIFIEYKMLPLMQRFNSNCYKVVDFLYPGQIKAWELKRAGSVYWKEDENKCYALTWLFEEKLQWSIQDIKDKVECSVFYKNGLSGLLDGHFNSSPYLAVEFLYPGQIKPWELNITSQNYFKGEENKKKILQWLVHEKLQWSVKEIDEKMSIKIFYDNKLHGLLNYFNTSPYKAMKFLYPNEEFPLLKAKRKRLREEKISG